MTETTTSDLPVAPTRGLWPGVAGFTLNGDVYCVDCALQWTKGDGSPVIDPDTLTTDDVSEAWFDVGAVLSSEEWDYQPVCGNHADCTHAVGDQPARLDVRTLEVRS